MMLTDKALEDFNKWLDSDEDNLCGLDLFQLNQNCINTLIIEWFDSVEIPIHIEPFYYKKQLYFKQYVLGYKDINEQNTYFKRTDATEEVIKKANEIYNNK